MKNCIRLLLFILLSLCLASNAFSQGFNADAMLYSEAGLEKDPSSLEDRPYDGAGSSDQPGPANPFWKEYKEGWTLQPYFSYKLFTFGLKNNDSGREVIYVPSTNMHLGFRTVYKGFGISLSTAIPKEEDPDRGDSKYIDFQFSFLFNQHGFDFIYQQYKGFYIEDDDLKVAGKFPQYPDLVAAKFGFNYYYTFNSEFCLKAGYSQTARQLKDAGSWLIMGNMGIFSFSDPNDIIPPAYTGDFTDLTGLNGMRFSWIGASGGYGYSWIWDEWWLTPSLFFGFNYVKQSYSITSGSYEQSVPFNPKMNLKISAGRHSDDRYYGISFFADNTIASTNKSIEISANSFVVLFYYGWRL